jgi:hypothetical protein
MRKISKTAKLAVAGVSVGTLALSGVAYAYWTTTGSGTGSATNAGSNGTVTLHASWAADALFPGGSQTVSFTADNAGASNLYVTTIKLDSVTVDSDHSSCAVADFTMPDVTANTNVLAGADHQAITPTGTLSFANSNVSQDGCKGATITLHLKSV